jgi:hypothetical protein
MNPETLRASAAPQAKTLEQAQAIINELWEMVCSQKIQLDILSALVDQQAKRILELEEKLNTNSTNSSVPPSKDQNRYSTQKKTSSGRKAGGQPGHTGKARIWVSEEQVDFIVPCYPASVCECGEGVAVKESYLPVQSAELPPIKPIITEYRLFYAEPCRCGKTHQGCLPPGIGRGFLAPRALALAATFTGVYRLSKRLVKSMFEDIYELPVSIGMISQSEKITSLALEPIYQEAHEFIQKAEIANADETGHKENGSRQWMWLAVASLVTVFMARAYRSAHVAKELLGAFFKGVLGSDRCGAYTWISAARRQLCWAHLKRDFTKIAERGGSSAALGNLLLGYTHHMFVYWKQVKKGTLSRMEFQDLMKPIQLGIENALALGSTNSEKDFSKTAATCNRLLKLKEALWTFVSIEGVEPTNNLAEQVIRWYVIWRKICLGTQSKRGSIYVERILTVVGSCKLQKRNVLEFIHTAISAHLGKGDPPSLIPSQNSHA